MLHQLKALKPKLTPFQSRMIKALIDATIVFASFGIATIIEQNTIHVDFTPLLTEMSVFSLVAFICLLSFRIYRAIWGYISLNDLFNLAVACVFIILFYFGLREVLHDDLGLNHMFFSQPIITGFVMLSGLAGIRILYRIYHFGGMTPNAGKSRNAVRVLLVGAGDDAELFIRSVMNNPHSAYRIVGLLDPSRARQKRTIHSIPVLGKPQDLQRVIESLQKKNKEPQRIIFTNTAETKKVPVDVLIKEANTLGLQFSRLPSLTEFKQTESIVPQLKPIAIEDLIGRPQATIDTDMIERLVHGKRVLITGAGGSIGSELSKQIASFTPDQLCLLDNSEYNLYAIDWDIRHNYTDLSVETILSNIRDKAGIDRIFKNVKPDIVFHAAALKHVPLVELNPIEGILTNVIGTRNVVEAAMRVKAQAFVQISTDKAVNPTNIMGASKRIGEYFAQALDLEGKDTRFITVRFGNVLGSSGSVVPLFKKQLEMGGPLTITHPDIKRYFMTIKEAVGLVLQASAAAITQNKGERGYIFVLDMGEPLKIIDVARQMIRLVDKRPDIDIAIHVIGLRPGEKLYEELFDDAETQLKTDIPSTFAANPAPLPLEQLKSSIEAIETAVEEHDIKSIISIIEKIVPGFDYRANQA